MPFRTETDVVIDPAVLLTELAPGRVADRCLEGEVVRFGLFTDEAIDDVQVQVGDALVPIVARFVVLAAGVGNAELLTKLSSRFSDQARRKSSKELVDALPGGAHPVPALRARATCRRQRAVRRRSLVASHASGRRVERARTWVVSPPIDDAADHPGPGQHALRAPHRPGPRWPACVDQLFAISPTLEKRGRATCEWSVYVVAAHPAPVAGRGRHLGGGPAGAGQAREARASRAFLAVWPSHLAYAQFVGDSVAERIGEALGRAGRLRRQPPSRPTWAAEPARAAWPAGTVADFAWQDWATFGQTWRIEHR